MTGTPAPHGALHLARSAATPGPQRLETGLRLQHRRIAIPADPELDRLAAMLKAQGAKVLRRPLTAAREVTDPAAVEAWLRTLAAGGIDQVIFLSGPGVERLAASAEGSGLLADVRGALGTVYKVARGPKPGRALHRFGLAADLTTPPSLQGLMACLEQQGGHAGRQIGVQLFADDPTPHLIAFLEHRGARVHPVAPYRCAAASGESEVVALIEAMASGALDGVAFSSALQITQLFQVASRYGLEPLLRRALAQILVAATTAIIAQCLHGFGARVDIVPPRQFSLRRLAEAFAHQLGARAAAAANGSAGSAAL